MDWLVHESFSLSQAYRSAGRELGQIECHLRAALRLDVYKITQVLLHRALYCTAGCMARRARCGPAFGHANRFLFEQGQS